jgi:hypothetical protein
MSTLSEAQLIATYAERVLNLSQVLDDDYFYSCLPLCVIDAVWSINVNYRGVQNVVERYCANFHLIRLRADRNVVPTQTQQQSITVFCELLAGRTPEQWAEEIFQNRQRTSSTNGILKADAVRRFAVALKNHEVEYLQDIPAATQNTSLEQDICTIPGQKSGISLRYFWMLAGCSQYIKADRMVLGFLEKPLSRKVTPDQAQFLLPEASIILNARFPNMSPYLLDNLIWRYQRAKAKGKGRKAKGCFPDRHCAKEVLQQPSF